MSTLRAIGLRLATVWVLVAPLAAHARLYLDAPDKWYPGDEISITLEADEDTSVFILEFGTDQQIRSVYDKFASVLMLQRTIVADFIKTGFGDCNVDDSACSFYYLDRDTFDPAPLVIPPGPAVTWVFRVREDAQSGALPFELDLGLSAFGALDTSPLPIEWKNGAMNFEVLPTPVPESSTWALAFVGLLLVGVRAYARSVLLPGPIRGLGRAT